MAVKMLHEAAAADPEMSVRMVREHRAMEQLAGSAVVKVHSLTSTAEGALCLVMEYLRGEDLDDHLAALEARGQRMSLARVLELLEPIVSTLELAHSALIVHRDMKPGNIFVLREAASPPVRLLDFGLAKIPAARPLTREDMIIGSPSYIAPEVWQGQRELDQRMDVYSVAAIIFRALAGRVPFDAGTIREKVELVTSAPRPSLRAFRPELPTEIDVWAKQALAIDPGGRFSRVSAMWAAFKQAATGG